jgi:hypothetical protein
MKFQYLQLIEVNLEYITETLFKRKYLQEILKCNCMWLKGEIYSLIEIIVGLFAKTLALSPSHYFLDVDHKDINT